MPQPTIRRALPRRDHTIAFVLALGICALANIAGLFALAHIAAPAATALRPPTAREAVRP